MITGYSDQFLNKLIIQGMNVHEIDLEYKKLNSKYKQTLFSVSEVENWLRTHLF